MDFRRRIKFVNFVITTAGNAAATHTSISSNINPAQTTQTITFTSTTNQISDNSPVTGGTVSFTNNDSAIAGCTNIAVSGSGNAICTAMLTEGTRTIKATYSGAATFATSNGSLTQTVNSPTVVTGSQFCNNGGIALTDNSAANPYPANITVSGLTGTISKVTVNLNGLSLPRTQDLDLLLVGPGGQALKILSDVGDAGSVTNINLTLDDAAATAMPIGSALTGGTYKPTDGTGVADSFPAPAPSSSVNAPAPSGAATFASVYNTMNGNGTWSLYAVDDSLGGGAGSLSGVCLNFTLNKFTTTTTIASSLNPSNQGDGVTFTASATSSNGTPTSGTVQFFDGATSLGTGTLNGSGQATLTTSSLIAGSHNITAQYLGTNIGAGGGGFAASTSSVLSQTVLIPTAAAVTVSGRVLEASGRGIPRAFVTMTDTSGNVRTAITNPFGYYRFTEVQVGEGYVISVSAKNKRFARFTTQFMVINNEIENLNFTQIE